MTTFDKLLFVFAILCVLWEVYQLFIRKPKTYKHYKSQVSTYDFLKRKRKSITLLEEVLRNAEALGLDETETVLIHADLATRYVKIKDYQQAARHFDAAFQVIERDGQPWRYTPYFLTALQVFLHVGQRERAKEIYADLVKRQSYDKRYKHIKKAEAWLDSPTPPPVIL